jgi:hypothetical protein
MTEFLSAFMPITDEHGARTKGKEKQKTKIERHHTKTEDRFAASEGD